MQISARVTKKYRELPNIERRELRRRFAEEIGLSAETMRKYLMDGNHCAPTVGGWLVQHITERWSACFENQEVESELEEETQTV
ncbi:MAG: hypothetical protein U0Y10_17535 [Spirosomataceae bacterium]